MPWPDFKNQGMGKGLKRDVVVLSVAGFADGLACHGSIVASPRADRRTEKAIPNATWPEG
jgi:hypothetical protein